MSIKWKFNYGLAAVIAAVAVIAISLVANPIIINPMGADQIFTASPFLVMLTDPPTVPEGTTQLNLTYADISVHVTYPNYTSSWLSVDALGTVDLLSLVNMSQTLAATTIPTGSEVDKIQFSIVEVKAVIQDQTYDVTSLSDSIVMTILNSEINQTLSGVLIDFNPTLVQIESTDEEGIEVNYYVLVPSGTARIVGNLRQEQTGVGTVVELQERHREDIRSEVNGYTRNVTISDASVSVNGNVTTLSVTIKNEGNTTFNIFGLTIHGEFNTTRTTNRTQERNGQNYDETEDETNNGRGQGNGNGNNNGNNNAIFVQIHPRTIPFKVNGTSLLPLFGSNQERDDENAINASLALSSGETITLTFSNVISLQPGNGDSEKQITVITPTSGENYTIRLMGEGSQTFDVTALT